jgi:hypothetical protein
MPVVPFNPAEETYPEYIIREYILPIGLFTVIIVYLIRTAVVPIARGDLSLSRGNMDAARPLPDWHTDELPETAADAERLAQEASSSASHTKAT